jgi:hypothetical protein
VSTVWILTDHRFLPPDATITSYYDRSNRFRRDEPKANDFTVVDVHEWHSDRVAAHIQTHARFELPPDREATGIPT